MSEDHDQISPLTSAFKLRWDVFLSFRGEDTRKDLVSFLYDALDSTGNDIQVFKDNNVLVQGDDIAEGLLEAIEYSSAAIAIISPNYASSRWCLEELAKICEYGRRVVPVFYHVDPSDVRRQRGPFEKDFGKLEERFGVEKVVRWRKAMEIVGGKVGFVCNRPEEEPIDDEQKLINDAQKLIDDKQLIHSIVKRVMSEVIKSPMVVAPFVVGLDSRVEQLMEPLNAKINSVHVLGLHGIGGIGKTTLAKALYNRLAKHFDHRIFILNVRETYAQHGNAVFLQNNLIRSLSNGTAPVDNEHDGSIAIKTIFQKKRVLLVLDDVETIEQLTPLAGDREWLSEGSRVIISTRNAEVLQTGFVNEIYEVKELGSSDSLKVFSYYALRREKPIENIVKLCKKIVSLTGGLPLALEVFGSFLFDKKENEWRDALKKLKQIRPHSLQDVLSISFNALDKEDQCIFLDIACLFLNLEMKRDDLVDVLRGCGYSAETTFATLKARSLVKVGEDDKLFMHDQIRDMARQIVRDVNFSNPGKHSRIWDSRDVMNVLQGMKGSQEVEGIILDLDQKNFPKIMSAKLIAQNHLATTRTFTSAISYMKEWHKEYFQNGAKEDDEVVLYTTSFNAMVNLRLLQFSKVKLEGDFHELPASLKFLQWRKCSLESLPYDFCPDELGVLDLSESKLKRVWGSGWKFSWNRRTVASKLKVLNLYGCYNITETPDLSVHRAMEKLILERCSKLERIHKSINDLNALRHLNLRECSNLAEFPKDVSGLRHLEVLILSGCSRLKDLPDNIRSMISLRELLLDKTNIEKLPATIFHLTRLEKLSLGYCSKLKHLPECVGKLFSLRELDLHGSAVETIPESIGFLENLETLDLSWCQSLTEIPNSIGDLKSLTKFRLTSSRVKFLPESIGSISYLMELSIGECSTMPTLPKSIEGLSSMVELVLDQTLITHLPDEIRALRSLKKFEMRNCKNLCSLPEAIGAIDSLDTLLIINAAITELPESIGSLENLVMLNLTNCQNLVKLPERIGELSSLRHLLMENTGVTRLPESFGMLSNLMILKMGKKPADSVNHVESEANLVSLPSSFCNLSLLEEFDAKACKISGEISDDFEKLSSLEILNFGYNDFRKLPSSLEGLSNLKKLFLPHCKNLISLPPLPSSLLELDASNCTALESISGISNLEHLQELKLTNCQKLEKVPGLECLKSLRRLHMIGCSHRASEELKKLNKEALKKIYDLSIPGSEIPDWFTQEVICYKERRNNAIKRVIIGVVVSVDIHKPDVIRDSSPEIPDIKAKILRVNKYVVGSTLSIGVPKTHEDQFYMCRYENYHPLVSMLRDGDKIEVARQNPPLVQGVELRKCGIHLVFEGEDEYDGDEKYWDESEHTVSERLRRFINISEENGSTTPLLPVQERKIFGCLEGMFGFFRRVFQGN